LTIVEIKSCRTDFDADQKWPDYLGFCDRFYFAVDLAFPANLLPPEEGVLDNIRIQLKRGDSTLRGTIVDGAGKSVPGAWVIAHDQSYGIKGVRFLIETNGRAEYELPLIAGRKYLIEAYKKGHDFSRVWKEVSMPPGGLTLPPLRLEKEK